jgi:putative ABC transport system permease protein
MSTIRFEPIVVVGALGLSVLAGVVTGVVAALRASKRDLLGALREGGRGSPSRSTGRLQNALVVSEVAMALVLLVGAAVLLRHFQSLRSADLGYRTEGMVTLQVAVDTDRYATVQARGTLLDQIQERVARLPDVSAVGITSVNPLCCGDWGAPIRIDGVERPADAPPFMIHHAYATSAYFDAMRIPVVRGRNFGPQDAPDAPPVVIVDEALAARFWPGEDPVGKRVGLDREGQPWRTVVGVVPHVYREGDFTEAWYLPLAQEPTGRSAEIIHLMIHERSDGALQAARRAVADLDPTLATFGGATLPSLRTEAIGQDRVGAVLAGVFAVVGLLLACLGLYGLMAYRVTLQTRELGTRLALGATGGGVVRLVIARSMRLFGAGLVLGLVASLGMNRLLAGLVPGVEMASPALVAGLTLLLSAAALGAAFAPAARAAGLDPARTVQGG